MEGARVLCVVCVGAGGWVFGCWWLLVGGGWIELEGLVGQHLVADQKKFVCTKRCKTFVITQFGAASAVLMLM